MGISARIRVAGRFDTPEQEQCLSGALASFDWPATVSTVTGPFGAYIEISPGYNWYEPGGGRGHWPGAKDVILAVQGVLPDRDVYYGHEFGLPTPGLDVATPDPGVLVTPSMLAEYDAAWETDQRERDLDDVPDYILVTHERVRAALAELDGSDRAVVRLLTGLTDDELDALGGINERHAKN